MKLLLFLLINLSGSLTASAHGISEADKGKILAEGSLEYLKQGASHMLTGYDHLLFLFGVVFLLTKFTDILKLITAFTVGHCITLMSATLLCIHANYYLIDAVIALTVCYKAFDNLDGFKKYLGIASPKLLLIVFIFGLIHGFGLSSRLQELPLGRDGLIVLRILLFNIGVEVGQIIALVVMLLVLSQLRSSAYFQRFSKVANAGLMAAGVLLLLMQLHGYQHTRFADDFPLNRDEHYQMHEQMDTNKDIEATAPVR